MSKPISCVQCGHKKSCFVRGFCHHSEPGQHGVYCGHECTVWEPPYEWNDESKLQDFMFTFGENMGVNRDGWITISAPNESEARAAMWLIHGAKWAFCYTPESFKPEYFPAGELAHFSFSVVRSLPVLLNKVDGYKPLTDDYLSQIKGLEGEFVVACKICTKPTSSTGTKLCDRCWELERQIQANPEIAQRIVNNLWDSKDFISEDFGK